MFWKDRRVLVAGGTGFIGSHAVRALVARGARVTTSCLAREKSGRLADLATRVEIVEADLREPHDAERICRNQDMVISFAHCDGSLVFKRSRPAYLFRQNMLITLNMLHAASECGVKRFVLTSSSEVYPLDSPVPTAESHAFSSLMDRPTDGYVWSKRMSELATTLFRHEYGMDVLIARPSNVYGPGDDFDAARGRVIPSFIRQAINGEPIVIWGTGEQVRSFLFVEDLARGVLDLAEQGRSGEAVNFAGSTSTIRAVAELVVALCGSAVEIRCAPDKPAGPLQRVFDCSVAEHRLGFRPAVSLEDGLARTINAYRRSLGRTAARA